MITGVSASCVPRLLCTPALYHSIVSDLASTLMTISTRTSRIIFCELTDLAGQSSRIWRFDLVVQGPQDMHDRDGTDG